MNARVLGLWFGYLCVGIGILLTMCCCFKMLFTEGCSALAVMGGDLLLLWGLYRVGLIR